MKTFTKWLLIAAMTATASFFANQAGVWKIFIKSDLSYLTSVIMALFIVGTYFCGKLAHSLDENQGNPPLDFRKNLENIEYLGDRLPVLGLLGTVIGMSLTLYSTLDPNQNTAEIIQQLKLGTSTAFYTTILGIVTEQLLNLQVKVIKNSVNE